MLQCQIFGMEKNLQVIKYDIRYPHALGRNHNLLQTVKLFRVPFQQSIFPLLQKKKVYVRNKS